MRFIDPKRVEHKLPSTWLSDAKNETDAVGKLDESSRAKAINARSEYWRDLKSILNADSSDKCWYCESKQIRSDNAVDHYRPKNNVVDCTRIKGYWWLAFRWDNYHFSCTYCNSRRVDEVGGTEGGKHDHFPLWDESRRAT